MSMLTSRPGDFDGSSEGVDSDTETILELHAQEIPARKIAKTLKVGRNATKKIIAREELIRPGAIESGENLLLLGKTGEGKTYLAVAIGRRL